MSRKNPEETVKNILSTALELFKSKGYEQTSVLDIVQRMGVSRGSFYHHFKSKEEVLYALLEGREDREKQLAIYEDDQLSGLEKIKKLLFFGVSDDAETTQMVFIWLDLLKDPRILAEYLKECQARNIGWITDLVKAGMEDGSIKNNNPIMLGELIFLLLGFWVFPTIYDPIDLETFTEKLGLIKQTLDHLGCPLVDEEVEAMFKDLARDYEEKKLKGHHDNVRNR